MTDTTEKLSAEEWDGVRVRLPALDNEISDGFPRDYRASLFARAIKELLAENAEAVKAERERCDELWASKCKRLEAEGAEKDAEIERRFRKEMDCHEANGELALKLADLATLIYPKQLQPLHSRTHKQDTAQRSANPHRVVTPRATPEIG